MKRALLLLVCALPTFAQTPDAAVRQVIAQYVEARKTSNAELLQKILTPDIDQLVSSGEWRRGREEAVRGMQASSKSEGKRTISVDQVRLPAPDIAIADARYELHAASGGAARKMWSTFVLVKQNGNWRITAIRNMLPAAAAR